MHRAAPLQAIPAVPQTRLVFRLASPGRQTEEQNTKQDGKDGKEQMKGDRQGGPSPAIPASEAIKGDGKADGKG
eukprot:COSAG02_NODE_5894_length_3956_cov_4.285196_1_plen_74_part_00